MIKTTIAVPLNMSEILMRRLIECLYGIHYNQFPEEYESDIRKVIDVIRGERAVDDDLKAAIERLRKADTDLDKTQHIMDSLKLNQFIRKLYRYGNIVETESEPTEGLRDIIDLICSSWMHIDEFFAIEAICNLDPLIERFMELKAIFIQNKPPKEAREHLTEATQCYLQGFYQASVIVCRSVVECVLSKELRKRGQNTDRLNLEQKIDNALKEQVIDPFLCIRAHSVRKSGNAAVHRAKFFSRKDALKCLEGMQSILKHVYAL